MIRRYLLKRGLVTGVLSIICIGLGILVVVELATTPTPPKPDLGKPPTTVQAKGPQLEDGFSFPELQEFAEITKRPLFREGRRPKDPPKLASEKQGSKGSTKSAKPPPYKLIGVVITGSKRVALVQDNHQEGIKRLQIGQQLQGWRVTSIKADTLSLQKGDRRTVLELVRRTQSKRPQRRRNNR